MIHPSGMYKHQNHLVALVYYLETALYDTYNEFLERQTDFSFVILSCHLPPDGLIYANATYFLCSYFVPKNILK